MISVRGLAMSAKLGGYEAAVEVYQAKKGANILGQVEVVLVFSGEGATPSAEDSKLRWMVLLLPRKHEE